MWYYSSGRTVAAPDMSRITQEKEKMVRNGICAQWPLFVVISVIPAAFASVSYANVIWDTSTYHVSDLIETNGYANNGATVYLESNVLLDGELQIHQSSGYRNRPHWGTG